MEDKIKYDETPDNEEQAKSDMDDAEKLKEKNEKVMPFLDHLEEMRNRMLKAIAAVIIMSIVAYFFSQDIMKILTAPFPMKKLIFLAPTEGFIVHIKVSLFAAIIVSLPIIFYQMWQFVVPGLLEKEKKYVPLIVLFSTLFFLLGAAFCYFVIIPLGLNFLLSWGSESLEANITIKEYLKFVTMLVLVFGIVFELPLLSFFLTKMGMLTPEFLRKNRRYGIVLIFVVAAILTPPDVVTQLFLAGPLILLFEASIWVSYYVVKGRKSGESEEEVGKDSE